LQTHTHETRRRMQKQPRQPMNLPGAHPPATTPQPDPSRPTDANNTTIPQAWTNSRPPDTTRRKLDVARPAARPAARQAPRHARTITRTPSPHAHTRHSANTTPNKNNTRNDTKSLQADDCMWNSVCNLQKTGRPGCRVCPCSQRTSRPSGCDISTYLW
jgi:hypothetical protein